MLIFGEALEQLRKIEDNFFHSIVTDPPYGLNFMGKRWDYDVPSVELWRECLRVLRPGGHLLSFAGTRTQHRMTINIEDAGFEIRDMIAWVFASGFPKSHDVSKAIDRMAGAVRPVLGKKTGRGASLVSDFKGGELHAGGTMLGVFDTSIITGPATADAKEWDGWGSALKPALEPITLARKPLSEKTIAKNVLRWETGGINIDGCRVPGEGWERDGGRSRNNHIYGQANPNRNPCSPLGRFPANFIHDGSQMVLDIFPATKNEKAYASRFFYCPKAQKKDREEGLDEFGKDITTDGRNKPIDNAYLRGETLRKNTHPTVKPTELMRYLVRLVTPKEGFVLDPFMGSGSTGKACRLEGFNFYGIEREKEYFDIAKNRINFS